MNSAEKKGAAKNAVSKNDELFIKNKELCIKHDGFCIYNDEFCSGRTRRLRRKQPNRWSTVTNRWRNGSSMPGSSSVARSMTSALRPVVKRWV